MVIPASPPDTFGDKITKVTSHPDCARKNMNNRCQTVACFIVLTCNHIVIARSNFSGFCLCAFFSSLIMPFSLSPSPPFSPPILKHQFCLYISTPIDHHTSTQANNRFRWVALSFQHSTNMMLCLPMGGVHTTTNIPATSTTDNLFLKTFSTTAIC